MTRRDFWDSLLRGVASIGAGMATFNPWPSAQARGEKGPFSFYVDPEKFLVVSLVFPKGETEKPGMWDKLPDRTLAAAHFVDEKTLTDYSEMHKFGQMLGTSMYMGYKNPE